VKSETKEKDFSENPSTACGGPPPFSREANSREAEKGTRRLTEGLSREI